MIENYPKCCQCGQVRKEEEILAYFVNNSKFYLCKMCFEKNLITNSQSIKDNPQPNDTNLSQVKIILNNENKKLDLNEPIKKNDDSFLLNKKRRISKKIIFKKSKSEKNLDKFTNIINNLIFLSADKNKLIIISKIKNKSKNKTCNLCKKTKLIKEKKMIKFSSSNDFNNFFDEFFKIISLDENKQNLIKISQTKYNQILQQENNYLNIKTMKKGQDLSFKSNEIICLLCIHDVLLKNNGIKLLWENLVSQDEKNEKKNLEILSGLENMLINTSKNNPNHFSENDKKEENKMEKSNIVEDDINQFFNDKKANIFDLILGDEEGDHDINDIENNSDEYKSIKNKNNNENQKVSDTKKDKKIKKGKSRENKVTFKKTVENYNIPSQNTINNNINQSNICTINNINQNINNNIENNNYGINDKNINIVNMNNINNINQFNDQKYIKKNLDQIQPLFYNLNYSPPSNQGNPLFKSNILNGNNIGYLNNAFTSNEESIYDRLNNQLASLKNKLSLISNLNNSRMANSNTLNSDLQILVSNNIFKENLFYFQNSMHIILNYMDNISEMLDKYSCINENSLALMNSMINGNINTESLIQLKNNSNYFSQLLNYNYNIQKMNTELCDIINKHLNH